MEGRYLANNDAASGGTYTDDTNNFYSKVKDYGNQIKTGTTDLATTDPREWTDNQILGVLTGIIALWSLVLISCIMKGYCDKRRRKKRQQVGIGDKTEALLKKEVKKPSKHKMTRPTVIRAAAPATFGGEFDASDTNKLPLGARLHGAHKLRTDGLTGSGVRVAIIDSGIDHTHPGFHDKVRTKRWYRKGTPLEEDDHGTHVAGTIHFMAPDADLFDYRVFGAEGIDGDLGIANSIRSAVDVDKCHVINMSLRCSYPVRPEVKRAIRYAYKKGVHLVCAAGNSGDGFSFTDETFTFPARFEETISVAAVRKEEGLPATSFSESNAQVDYSGIGRDVVSLKPNGGLQTMSGTSMATPHVTGLIACLLSNSKKYTDKKLRQLLKEKYLVDIGSKGYDKQTGEGFVTYLAGAAGGDKNELFDLLALVE
jgi:subtilisin family serine protease